MPFYRVLVHGEGDFVNGIKGFYATRCCRAINQESAASKAMETLRTELEKQKLGKLSSLEVEETWGIEMSERGAADRGFTFY